MKITRHVFDSYGHCPYKAHLLLRGEVGTLSAYETLQTQSHDALRPHAETALVKQHHPASPSRPKLATLARLKAHCPLFLQGVVEDDRYTFSYDGLARKVGSSSLGAFHYVPVLFDHDNTLREQVKLNLAFGAFVLEQVQGYRPTTGIIVYSHSCIVTNVKLARLEPRLKEVIDGLLALSTNDVKPQLMLNKHCEVCQFCDLCRREAQATDHLSLLRGLSETEVKKYNRKGIFTVDQLSYTFRPRKRRTKDETRWSPYYHSLQALAIRDKKIYVLDKPTIPSSSAVAYLDMEGSTNAHSIYLIGLITVVQGKTSTYSYWGDSAGAEDAIFLQLFDTLAALDDVCIFHFGSYESRAFKRMASLASDKGIPDLARQCHNVLSSIYSNVYFPTYSNSLKDIAKYLGFNWTHPAASGISAMAWRTQWERSHDPALKELLVRYNHEDCLALQSVTDCVRAIATGESPVSLSSVLANVKSAAEVQNASDYQKFGRPRFVTDAFQVMADCAYFDYQREKVYFRTNRNLKRVRKALTGKVRGKPKPNKVVEYKALKCPFCGGNDIARNSEQSDTKLSLDLRISKAGISRWITERRAAHHQCVKCGKPFRPRRYAQQQKIGHNLLAWGVHQHISNRITLDNLALTVRECFGLDMGQWHFERIKAGAAEYYRTTYEKILRSILHGPLIHADETGAPLRHHITGYVWVFANMESVAFMFRPTRKGDFLSELLKGFDGVLVTDFYTAYDSLKCLQQKCLVHLMRDLNEDILKNPFDEDLKRIGLDFGELMRPVIETIDRFGLKQRHLSKHLSDARKFVDDLGSRKLSSTIAEQYQKRFVKYDVKLFEFMKHDGVPWNNNNAEHAIKPFAKYRRLVKGMITEPGLTDYLVLLSIYQTCRYRNISFLDFLVSKHRDIDKYCGG